MRADDRVEPVIRCHIEQVAEEQLTDAVPLAPAARRRSPRRWRVRRARAGGRQRREAVHDVVFVDRDDCGVPAGVFRDPRCLIRERPGHEIEGHRGLEHLEVVDRARRFGVALSAIRVRIDDPR